MLAVAGILFPELLSSIGFSWPGETTGATLEKLNSLLP
jgi:hypothetical protein